uniref:trypsin n=1 Tax=Denticeps clupeoides TaxID=299321 RepID=A0AAY4AK84_9TELE
AHLLKHIYEQRIRPEKVIAHPKYNDFSFNNDIMLIKLSTPATFNDNVKPIPLATSCPQTGDQCLEVRNEKLLRKTGVLQCLDLPVLSHSSCKAAYGNKITDNMFCAGFIEGSKDSCQVMMPVHFNQN